MITKEWYQVKALEYFEGYHQALANGDNERAELCSKWYKKYSEAGRK